MSPSKVVVVTGAAAGVGRAIAHRFAKSGVGLCLVARDAEALKAVAREVEAKGAVTLVRALDVADASEVMAVAEDVVNLWGRLDVWVNDAMATVFAPFDEITPEEFKRVTDVTYLGFVHGTMSALKVMKRQNHGTIVQVGSALAYRGIPLQSAYCGAKHAIRGFTDALRTELNHDGSKVRLRIVQLPAMNTPQFDWARTHMANQPRPMGRVYQPECAAEAVWRATRGWAREYWVGRTTVMTILGSVVAPGFMDRYLARAWEGQERPRPVSPAREDNLHEPVGPLHSTRGAFGDEAQERALIIPGPVARFGVVAAGAAACVGLGLAAAALFGRSRAA